MDGVAWYHFRLHRMHHLWFRAAFKFVDYHRITPTDSLIFTRTEKMCLTKESKLGTELPYIRSLDNRKKKAFPKDNSAVWRSQLPSGDTCPFSFTKAVAWNSNRTKKRMDKSELWARGGKLLLCDYCKVCVVPECWIMSDRKTDISRMSWQSMFLWITFTRHVTVGVLKINNNIFVGGELWEAINQPKDNF